MLLALVWWEEAIKDAAILAFFLLVVAAMWDAWKRLGARAEEIERKREEREQ